MYVYISFVLLCMFSSSFGQNKSTVPGDYFTTSNEPATPNADHVTTSNELATPTADNFTTSNAAASPSADESTASQESTERKYEGVTPSELPDKRNENRVKPSEEPNVNKNLTPASGIESRDVSENATGTYNDSARKSPSGMARNNSLKSDTAMAAFNSLLESLKPENASRALYDSLLAIKNASDNASRNTFGAFQRALERSLLTSEITVQEFNGELLLAMKNEWNESGNIGEVLNTVFDVSNISETDDTEETIKTTLLRTITDETPSTTTNIPKKKTSEVNQPTQPTETPSPTGIIAPMETDSIPDEDIYSDDYYENIEHVKSGAEGVYLSAFAATLFCQAIIRG